MQAHIAVAFNRSLKKTVFYIEKLKNPLKRKQIFVDEQYHLQLEMRNDLINFFFNFARYPTGAYRLRKKTSIAGNPYISAVSETSIKTGVGVSVDIATRDETVLVITAATNDQSFWAEKFARLNGQTEKGAINYLLYIYVLAS